MDCFKNNNKFLQFEMWKECHNGCKFCCNKGQKDLEKSSSLQFILKQLDDPEVDEYNEIGFIGGEFFDCELRDSVVKDLFYKIFDKCANMVKDGKKDKIYITTALIYNMGNYLIPFLNHMRDLEVLNKILICTSYDNAYRFHTVEKEELWKSNMLKLYKLYPELGLHTEIIMTQFFIDAVLNDEFDIKEFQKKYHTRCDYIEPASGLYYKDKKEASLDLPGFFPTRNSYIEFLYKAAEDESIDFNSFLSMELRSSKLYYIDGGKRQVVDERRETNGVAKPIDTNIKYEIGLIDSDETMRSLALQVKEICGL